MTILRRASVTRYVTPLREGGSLPGLIEASDDGMYVLKFRGAGQGPKALVAEVVAGELARALGFPVPELAVIELDEVIARGESHQEIQDLLRASVGPNLGVDFLPGALPFTPAVGPLPDPAQSAEIVWLDALVTNVDRTARNPNMLIWHGRHWLIDHGAALYFHHSAEREAGFERKPFTQIKDHVLLPSAGSITEADARLAPRITPTLLGEIAAAIPLEWLDGDDARTYVEFLTARLASPRAFAEEAERARERR